MVGPLLQLPRCFPTQPLTGVTLVLTIMASFTLGYKSSNPSRARRFLLGAVILLLVSSTALHCVTLVWFIEQEEGIWLIHPFLIVIFSRINVGLHHRSLHVHR